MRRQAIPRMRCRNRGVEQPFQEFAARFGHDRIPLPPRSLGNVHTGSRFVTRLEWVITPKNPPDRVIRKANAHCSAAPGKIDLDQFQESKNGSRTREESMAAIAFVINGREARADVAPDTPLLWIVREHLKLSGTKFGCGSGLCGACTVHLDGKAVRSCQVAASQVAGKRVTTIEGLSPDGNHPL